MEAQDQLEDQQEDQQEDQLEDHTLVGELDLAVKEILQIHLEAILNIRHKDPEALGHKKKQMNQ